MPLDAGRSSSSASGGVEPAKALDPTIDLTINEVSDVERARRAARRLALSLGFSVDSAEECVLVVSELATNLVRYARAGELRLSRVADGSSRLGFQVESLDRGPGIADVGLALTDGFSTSGGLGAGLPAARRLADGFELTSSPHGTMVVARKWPRG